MWPWTKTSKNPAPDPVPQPEPPAFTPPPAAPRVEEPAPAPVAAEVPVDPAPAPAPEPEHVQEDKGTDPVVEPAPAPASSPARKESGWSWLTSTRVVIAAATVPTLLSLVWTASTVAEIVGGLTGLAAGLLFDAVIVSTVAIAWVKPSIRTMASLAGWGGALLAAAVLAHHHWGTEQVAFAAGPLISKVLWFLALMGLTADEKEATNLNAAGRAAADAETARQQAMEQAKTEDAEADDCSLTVEQRRKVAAAKQNAAFKRKLADAEAEEAKADIYAQTTVLMAKDRAEADRLTQRYALAGEVAGQLPIEILAHFMPGLGQEVPHRATEVPHLALDRSRTEPAAADMATAASAPAGPVAGFGAGLVEASARLVPALSNAGSDLREHPREEVPGPVPSNAGSDLGERSEEEGAALARQRLAEQAEQRRADALALWKQGWCAPEIAAQMGRDKRTVRGYLVEEGVTAADMDQRIRDRVASYIEHKGPQAETRAMAADLHLTRSEAKAARERLATDGVEVYAPQQ